MPQEFKTAARRKTPIEFTIEGDDYVYKFVAPKRAKLILPMLSGDHSETDSIRDLFAWLRKGLGDDAFTHMLDRLEDEDDDLDIDILQELSQNLTKEVSGRPSS